MNDQKYYKPLKSYPLSIAWAAYKLQKRAHRHIKSVSKFGKDNLDSFLAVTGLEKTDDFKLTARCVICKSVATSSTTHLGHYVPAEMTCKTKRLGQAWCRDGNPNGDCEKFQPISTLRYIRRRVVALVPPMR